MWFLVFCGIPAQHPVLDEARRKLETRLSRTYITTVRVYDVKRCFRVSRDDWPYF